MQQDALDDTHLLRPPAHNHQSQVGIATIVVVGQLCPPFARIISNRFGTIILIKGLDGTAAHGHCHHAHLHIGWQCGHHGTSEVVSHTQSSHRADDRALSRVPQPRAAFGRSEVCRSQHLEAGIDIVVPFLPLGIALHIRLPKTKIDIEIGIGLSRNLLWHSLHDQSQHCDN